MIGYFANILYPYTLNALPFWIIYAIINGTIAFGLWILGHECGHYAFSNKDWANDALGFILHSTLLVPYFSWQHSHFIHHSRTNHMYEGESHVPLSSTSWIGKFNIKLRNTIGLKLFSFKRLLNIVVGWYMYIIIGTSGGPKRGFTSHIIVPNKLFPTSKLLKVWLSNLGVGVCIYLLYLWA